MYVWFLNVKDYVETYGSTQTKPNSMSVLLGRLMR